MSRRPLLVLIVTAPLLVGVLAPVDAETASASAPVATPTLVTDPAGLVNPFAGTGSAPVAPGNIGEFPGADVPFGMVQWSPDTTPDRVDGSGYSLSLIHI